MIPRRLACSLRLSFPVSLLVLRAAGLLVPGRQRPEWLAEWKAELWHVAHAARQESPLRSRGAETNRRQKPHESNDLPDTLAFAMGAFQDALWIRRNTPPTLTSQPAPSRFALGSASRCAASLAIWAAASLLLCVSLPSVRKVLPPSRYAGADELVMLSSDGFAGTQTPAIRLADYRSWKTSTRLLFSELAFYQPMLKRVHLAPHRTAELSIVRASGNLLPMLNLPSFATLREDASRLVVSETAWRRDFQSDPHIVGRLVEIAGRRLPVAGVISPDQWPLPGLADLWMIEDQPHLDAVPGNTPGFVLARMKSSGFPLRSGEWHYITVARQDASQGIVSDRFDCVPLAEQARQPLLVFLFTLLVALLALPATTPLPLGEYPRTGKDLRWRTRIRRWLFLASKFALIVPAVYGSSLALAYGAHFATRLPDVYVAQYVQLATSFFSLLFAFRWALQDQRRRCPVCLRLLTNPAHVGETSRNFLAWNGTELICAGGHGLLHIPGIPTSWFSTQRWLYLDPSWSGLFAEGYVTSTGLL